MFKITDHMTNTIYDNQNDINDILDIIKGITDQKIPDNTIRKIADTLGDMTFNDEFAVKIKRLSLDIEITCFNETENKYIKNNKSFNPQLTDSKRPDCIDQHSHLSWINPDIDMTQTWTSLLLQPQTLIGYYLGYNGLVTIEVRGNIDFTYTSDANPNISRRYTDPSEYTSEVIDALNNYPEDSKMPGTIDIEDDNWFEMFYTPYDENGYLRADAISIDVEPEGCTPQELIDIMKEYYDCPL